MFPGWDNFFFMIGSAAAGLIGLLFVVVTLTAGTERSQALRGASLYLSPTAGHFACVLLIGAVALVPRLPPWSGATIFGVIAAVGLFHGVRATIGIRTVRFGQEPPHWTDLWYYGVGPTVIYIGLAAAALAIASHAACAPLAVATMLLALLFLGIRNAWDLVTWLAPRRPDAPPPDTPDRP